MHENPRLYSPNMDSFRLQELGVGDASEAERWVSRYYELDGLVFEEKVADAVRVLLAHPEYGRFWQVEHAGKAVGYIVLTFGFDHEFGGIFGLVTDFFLLENARRKGLGSQVLQEVLHRAKEFGCKHLELAVLDHNTKAEKFYRKLGLKPQTGRRIFEIGL